MALKPVLNERILSIDAFKGFTAVMILIVHGVVFGIFTPDPVYFTQITEKVPIYFLIILAPIILMATWFTAFLFLAGLTIAYSYVNEGKKKDPNYSLVLKKKMVNAIALVILGAFYAPLLSHSGYNGENLEYSVITGFIATGSPAPLNMDRFWGHSVFAGIAMGMFVFTVIFHIIFTKFPNFTAKDILIRIMLILEVASIIVSFLLEYLVSTIGIYDNLTTYPLLLDFINRLYGGRHSMIPQMFFGFAGAIFAIIMGSDDSKEEKHRQIRIYGWLKGIVYFVIFLLITIISKFDYISMITANDLTVLFHLGNYGMMHWLVTYFFERFDFRKNRELGISRSAFLRTFAPVTMTVYCMEAIFAAILRRIYIGIFGADVFPWSGILNVVYMLIIISFWYFIIKLWSRIKFTGSFEWGVVMIMRMFGTRSNRFEKIAN